MQIVLQHTGKYLVTFKYNPALVNFMRKVPGREYNGKTKEWIVPQSSKPQLEEVAFNAKRFQRVVWKNEAEIDHTSNRFYIPPMPELTIEHGLKFEPKPYQAQGIACGLKFKRFMNADDPGLGKTFQTIGTLDIAERLFGNVFPCVVTCPGSVKYHWQREWAKFTNRKAMVLNDDVLDNWAYYAKNKLYDVFIVNYESLKKYFVKYISTPRGKSMLFGDIVLKESTDLFKSIIIDESHRGRNYEAQLTKFVIKLSDAMATNKEWKITLSGTPVINNYTDFIPQLRIMDRLNEFGGERNFRIRFCSGPNKSSNGDELRALLWQTCYFRRTKAEVKKDLPQLTRQIMECDITNRKEYDLAQRDLVNYLKLFKAEIDSKSKRNMRNVARMKLNTLIQISARGKVKAVVESAKDFLLTGKKLLIYCELHAVVDELKKAFPQAVTITGREDAVQKQRAIDAFSRNPKIMLGIISAAAGTGTDGLQNQCSEMYLIEHPWHDAGCVQIESRLDRTGQNEPVTATYWQAVNTADEKKWAVVETKKKLADTIASGEEQEDYVDMMANMFNEE